MSKIEPEVLDKLNQQLRRGKELFQQEKYDQALEIFERLASIATKDANVFRLQGITLFQLHRYDEAIEVLQRSHALDPENAVQAYYIGSSYYQKGMYEEAVNWFGRAVELKEDYAAAWINLGVNWRKLKETEKALFCVERALTIDDSLANAHNNRANYLRFLGKRREAVESYKRAVELSPNDQSTLVNIGDVFQELGEYDLAKEYFEKVLQQDPSHPKANTFLSFVYLIRGQLEMGWPYYIHRWGMVEGGEPKASMKRQEWQGEELQGKTLFVYHEQGYGDTIQFIRYLKVLRERGVERLIFRSQEAVLDLVKTTGWADVWLSGDDRVPEHDYQVALMELPRLLNTGVKTIPGGVPYLHPVAEKRAQWAPMVQAPEGKLKVGMVWAGSTTHANDHNRSVGLEAMSQLLMVENTAWFSLQKGDPANALTAYASRFTNLGPDLESFHDTAAALLSLDLLITVDTSVAHLAAALGKPVWIMLPFSPDWRWMLQRADSPWYPSARLFRQSEPGRWDDLLQTMQIILEQVAAGRVPLEDFSVS
uniref:Uncharacterized protein n=1 Tax=Magnetococcus massalia (strain MO-1) TaxID=451514 RepID=A0A1S7LJ42_MAGMO|nr:conserved protein of unknown function [Include 6 copies of TPR repeat] [Candidatus Magnetococcus massalia]